MSEALFVAASVFIPLVFGLVPAFVPTSVSIGRRWILWFAAAALAGWYVHLSSDAPSPHPLMALTILILSAGLSLMVLIRETVRPARRLQSKLDVSGGAERRGRWSPALPPAPRSAARRKK